MKKTLSLQEGLNLANGILSEVLSLLYKDLGASMSSVIIHRYQEREKAIIDLLTRYFSASLTDEEIQKLPNFEIHPSIGRKLWVGKKDP